MLVSGWISGRRLERATKPREPPGSAGVVSGRLSGTRIIRTSGWREARPQKRLPRLPIFYPMVTQISCHRRHGLIRQPDGRGKSGAMALFRRRATVPSPALIDKVARCYVAVRWSPISWICCDNRDGLTDGMGRPFGDDFVNFWSGPFLAWHQRSAEIYNFSAFHAFEQSVVGASLMGYHYSYPPTLLLLSAPLALIPYGPALVLWLCAGWFAFYRALRPPCRKAARCCWRWPRRRSSSMPLPGRTEPGRRRCSAPDRPA